MMIMIIMIMITRVMTTTIEVAAFTEHKAVLRGGLFVWGWDR
jgi:hypothetical protein